MEKPFAYESSIQAELKNTTGTRKRAKDTELFYKERLMHAAYTLTDQQWDKLSEPAQRWVVEAIKNYNSGKSMPPYPDEDQVKAKRSAAASKSAKNRERNLKRSKRGAGDRVKEIMLDYGIRTPPLEIHRILQQEGYKYSKHTILLVRSEFRRALQMLWEREMLTQRPDNLYDNEREKE